MHLEIKDSAFLAVGKGFHMVIDPVPASALGCEFEKLSKHPETFFAKVRSMLE